MLYEVITPEVEMSRDLVIKRLTGRRICPKCKEIYHIETLKPKKEGICDKDGSYNFV